MSLADFTHLEVALVGLAREQVPPADDHAGPEDSIAVPAEWSLRFDLRDLSERTGIPAMQFRAALASLIESRVFRRRFEVLTFDPDFRRWVHPVTGHRRLEGKVLAFCLSPGFTSRSIGGVS